MLAATTVKANWGARTEVSKESDGESPTKRYVDERREIGEMKGAIARKEQERRNLDCFRQSISR